MVEMRTVRSPTPRLILHLLHLYWCTCAFARSAYRTRVGGNAGICSDIGSCCRKRWMVAAQSGALRRYLQHSSCAGTTCDVTADHQPPPGRIPAWSLKSFFAPSFSRAAQCRRRCDTLRHPKPARSRMPRIWRQAILPGQGPPVGPPKRSLPLVLVQPHPCIPSVRRNLPDAYREGYGSPTRYEARDSADCVKIALYPHALHVGGACRQACCPSVRMWSEPCTLLLARNGSKVCGVLPYPCSQWEKHLLSASAACAICCKTHNGARSVILHHSRAHLTYRSTALCSPVLVAMQSHRRHMT